MKFKFKIQIWNSYVQCLEKAGNYLVCFYMMGHILVANWGNGEFLVPGVQEVFEVVKLLIILIIGEVISMAAKDVLCIGYVHGSYN